MLSSCLVDVSSKPGFADSVEEIRRRPVRLGQWRSDQFLQVFGVLAVSLLLLSMLQSMTVPALAPFSRSKPTLIREQRNWLLTAQLLEVGIPESFLRPTAIVR